jgi:hypothetical protein
MRYFLFISFCLMAGCSSYFRGFHQIPGNPDCIDQFRPVIQSAQYRTRVDVTGKHISGLMVIKKMPDSSLRLVFSNEMGFKFFDFGFSADSGFRVYQILHQMDKKPVIKTLRKDFELVLMMHTEANQGYILRDSLGRNFYAFPQEKGVNYYITDSACQRLLGMMRASRRKPVVEAVMENYQNGLPDTIGISHRNFNFEIGLKRIQP